MLITASKGLRTILPFNIELWLYQLCHALIVNPLCTMLRDNPLNASKLIISYKVTGNQVL